MATENKTVNPKFGSESDVERLFGIGRRQLRLMRMKGTAGPPWRKVSGEIGKTGGRILYDLEACEAWIQAQPGGGGK